MNPHESSPNRPIEQQAASAMDAPETTTNEQPPHPEEFTTNPAQQASSPQPRRKLNAAMKDELCRLVHKGHSITAAARCVGVSDRAVRYAAQRDALFKLRIGKEREAVSDLCLETLRTAAADPEQWHAAPHLMRFTYPERMHPKAGLMPIAETRMLLDVVRDTFDSFLTDPTQRARFGEHLTQALTHTLRETKSHCSVEDLL